MVKPYKFYSGPFYKELSIFVNSEDEKNYHRTIHKAKGIEFKNVLLILEDEKNLDFYFKTEIKRLMKSIEFTMSQ